MKQRDLLLRREQNELGEGGWWDRTHVDKAISDVRPGDAVC